MYLLYIFLPCQVQDASVEKCCNSSACNHGSCAADSGFNINMLNYAQRDDVQEQSSSNTKKQRQLDKLKHHDDIITCSSFGLDKYTKFPGYHFCTLCKHWDSRSMENKRLNRKMKAYKCEINHKSYVTPGKKNKEWCPSRSITKSSVIPTSNTCAAVSRVKKKSSQRNHHSSTSQ